MYSLNTDMEVCVEKNINNIIKFPVKKKYDEKQTLMLEFSNRLDKEVIRAMFDLKLSPEEVVAILANRTREAANSCLEIERIKEFAVRHIQKAG